MILVLALGAMVTVLADSAIGMNLSVNEFRQNVMHKAVYMAWGGTIISAAGK